MIKVCDDAGLKDTLNFLMSREVAHQKMFEAALDSMPANFPPGTLPGDEAMNHAYFQDAASYGTEGATDAAAGFDLVQQHSQWGFELDQNPLRTPPKNPHPNPSAAPPPSNHHPSTGGMVVAGKLREGQCQGHGCTAVGAAPKQITPP